MSTIAPHILAISLFLSVLWGRYLWRKGQGYYEHRDARSLTELLVAQVPFALSFSYVLRTVVVLAGAGDAFAGQVAFFALLAPTVLVGIIVNLPASRR